jgi:hypothetical protein
MNEMSKKIGTRSDDAEQELTAFVEGEVYFFVTYPDASMHFPLIESYVFLGVNFSDEDLDNTWYFQPTADFNQFGSALTGFERPVFCANEEQLVEFQNEQQLFFSLKQAAIRRLRKLRTKGDASL